jgi:hypothetical protein
MQQCERDFPSKIRQSAFLLLKIRQAGSSIRNPLAPESPPGKTLVRVALTSRSPDDFSAEHTSHHGSARQAIASDHEEIFSPASIGDRAYGSIGVKASRLPDRVLKILRKIFLGVPKDLDDGLTVREG